MKFKNGLSSCLVLSLAAAGYSQQQTFGVSQISAGAGSVGGIYDAPTGGGSWTGLTDSALGATITYTYTGQASARGGLEFKFTNNSGTPGAKVFQGAGSENPDRYVVIQGASGVSEPGTSGAPAYYTASWTATTGQNANATGTTDSGTYDPWDVRESDLQSLGTPRGGTADLYFQTGINKLGTGFSLLPGQSGSYALDSYVEESAGGTVNLLGITVRSDGTIDLSLENSPEFEVYLLGSNANDPTATPFERVSNGNLIDSLAELQSVVAGALNPNGSLNRDLIFGVLRNDFLFGPDVDPNSNDVLFTWHTDTFTTVQGAVPGPAAVVPFILGALGTLRRRKRA